MKSSLWSSLLVLGATFCHSVHGQVVPLAKDTSPLTLSVGANYIDDVNPTAQSDSFAAPGLTVSALGQRVIPRDSIWYKFDYEATGDLYWADDDDLPFDDFQDFQRYRAEGLVRFFVNDESYVDANYKFLNETQRFGEGISRLRNDIASADEFTRHRAEVKYAYGTDVNTRFVTVKLGYREDEFEKNNPYSELFDLQQTLLETNLGFRYSGRTSFITRFELYRDDYQSQFREDSVFYRLLAGVDWVPTGKSSMRALVGYQRRDFDDNLQLGINDSHSSGLSWFFEYKYRPREDWEIIISSEQSSEVSISETTADVVTQVHELSVEYEYSEQWQYGADVLVSNIEFNEDIGQRELDDIRATAWVNLALDDNNSIRLQASYGSSETSDNRIDFSQNEARLTWSHAF